MGVNIGSSADVASRLIERHNRNQSTIHQGVCKGISLLFLFFPSVALSCSIPPWGAAGGGGVRQPMAGKRQIEYGGG
jgi:hypothetical protein